MVSFADTASTAVFQRSCSASKPLQIPKDRSDTVSFRFSLRIVCPINWLAPRQLGGGRKTNQSCRRMLSIHPCIDRFSHVHPEPDGEVTLTM